LRDNGFYFVKVVDCYFPDKVTVGYYDFEDNCNWNYTPWTIVGDEVSHGENKVTVLQKIEDYKEPKPEPHISFMVSSNSKIVNDGD
jgi:hypothetical protein